ncbi:MAG: hypothetical protein JXR70_13940 [Spirochaetales bacterium]|nr:hypothetical protein [Spirochaetales bacterium]
MIKKTFNLFWFLIPCLLCLGTPIQAQTNYYQSVLQMSQDNPDHWGPIHATIKSDEIIILGIPSYYDSDPMILRVSLTEPDSFGDRILKFHFDEWQYQDGIHKEENCGLLRVKKGLHVFDGVKFEANNIRLNHAWSTLTIEHDFSKPPIVLAQCVTANEKDAVVIRIRNVTNKSFQMCLQEKEGSTDQRVHALEEIHYILVEQNPNAFIIDNVNHNWKSLSTIPDNKLDAKILFGAIQTTNGGDPCALRYSMDLPEKYNIRLQEETSADDETNHINEFVGIYQVVKPSLLGDIDFTGGNPDIRDAIEISRYIIGTSNRSYLGEYFEHGDVYRDARNTLHDALVILQYYVHLISGPLPIIPTDRPPIVPEPGDGKAKLIPSPSKLQTGEIFKIELHLQSKTQVYSAGDFEIVYNPVQITPITKSEGNFLGNSENVLAVNTEFPGIIRIIDINLSASQSEDLHILDTNWRVLPLAKGSINIFVNPKTLIDSKKHDLVNKQGSYTTIYVESSNLDIRPLYTNYNLNPLTSQVYNSLNIKNNGCTPIQLDKVKVRYYYTKDGNDAEIMNIDYAALGSSNITSSFGTGFYEIGFKPGLPTLAPGQETGFIQCQLHKINWAQYNQSNDYSFDKNGNVYNTKITVYYNESLVSGLPPAN